MFKKAMLYLILNVIKPSIPSLISYLVKFAEKKFKKEASGAKKKEFVLSVVNHYITKNPEKADEIRDKVICHIGAKLDNLIENSVQKLNEGK